MLNIKIRTSVSETWGHIRKICIYCLWIQHITDWFFPFISLFKKTKSTKRRCSVNTGYTLHIWTDNSCSWKWGDDWPSLFSTDDKETLWDSNYPHVTNVKHNPVRWSKSQLSQRDFTSDRKIEAVKQNRLHVHNSTTVKTQTIFKIHNNVTELLPWGGSTQSLAPAHTSGSDPCVDGRDRRDSRAGAGKGISPWQTHCRHPSPMWLPVPSQGLEQPQQGDYSEPGTCLESHHPHILLSVWCSTHRAHHSPIFWTHFGTRQLLWSFEPVCMS